jgi:hypothetical protein
VKVCGYLQLSCRIYNKNKNGVFEMYNSQLFYLSSVDVSRLGGLDMALALEDVEETLKLVYLGDCIVPG